MKFGWSLIRWQLTLWDRRWLGLGIITTKTRFGKFSLNDLPSFKQFFLHGNLINSRIFIFYASIDSCFHWQIVLHIHPEDVGGLQWTPSDTCREFANQNGDIYRKAHAQGVLKRSYPVVSLCKWLHTINCFYVHWNLSPRSIQTTHTLDVWLVWTTASAIKNIRPIVDTTPSVESTRQMRKINFVS